MYPLIHVLVYGQSIESSEITFWFYWPVALLLFVIFLVLFLCFWRCKSNQTTNAKSEETKSILNNQKQEKDFYTISLHSSEAEKDDNVISSVELKEITPAKSEKLFPRCSVRRKPENLQVEIHELPKKYPAASLSPRELFFQDLLREDNRSNSSVVFSNADNQPLEEAVLSALNKIKCDTKRNEMREYFIASVSPTQQNHKNNIFMFVNANEEVKPQNVD